MFLRKLKCLPCDQRRHKTSEFPQEFEPNGQALWPLSLEKNNVELCL